MDDPRKARRQRLLLLVVLNSLVLATGLVASVDLRRLQTPGGTALRWVEAAVFGSCDDYLGFSVPAADTRDPRSPAEVCHDLREATAKARTEQLTIGLRLDRVETRASEAVARLTITRAEEQQPVEVSLVRRAGKWRVLRDETTCASVGCA